MTTLRYIIAITATLSPIAYASESKITSTDNTGKTITFAHSKFDAESGCFVLGNSTVDQEEFAIALAKKTYSTLSLSTTIDIIDLSPETCDINTIETTDPDTTAHVESTLYNKQISHMTVMNGNPVVSVSDDPTHIFLVDFDVSHTIDTHYTYSHYLDYATAWTLLEDIEYTYVYDLDTCTTTTYETYVYTATSDNDLATNMTTTLITYSDRLIYSMSILKNATESGGSLVDSDKLTDLDGSDPAYIRFLEASSHQTFVALAPNAGDFGDAQSCIRATEINETSDAIDIVAVSKSISNHTGASGIQDLIGDSDVEDISEMYFDQDLQRLFVGLDLTSNDTHKQGIIVGRVEGDDITFESVIPLSLLDTTVGDTVSVIVGAGNHESCDPYRIYPHQIRTMKTSTNKTYLVTQVDRAPLDAENRSRKVYAMPLVITNDDASKIGTLSVNHTATGPVTENYYEVFTTAISEVDLTDTPTNYLFSGNASGYEMAASLVGNDLVNVAESDQITDIYILDDTVILSLKDDNPDQASPNTVMERGQMGLVASTALFDAEGTIAGWTPWEPLNMLYDSIHHLGVDTESEGFWAVHGPSADRITFKPWGPFAGGMINETLPLLDEYLTEPDTRVFTIRVFPKTTEGLANYRWTAACGYKILVLAKATGGNPFGTSTDYVTFTQTTDPDIANLGPIYCIESSRTTEGDTGWLFAGGYGGLAVLADENGDGWDAETGLTSVTDLSATTTLHHLPEINKTVYKLHSDGENIYALTRKRLYRFSMDGNKFSDPNVVTPASLDSTYIFESTVNEYLLDIAPLQRQGRGFIATTSGLYWLDDWSNTTTPDRNDWTEISFSGIPNSLVWKAPKPTIDIIGQPKDEAGIIGNLYVTRHDYPNSETKIYRFAATGTLTGTISSITSIAAINYDEVTDGLFKTIVHTLGNTKSSQLWPYLDFYNIPIADLTRTIGMD